MNGRGGKADDPRKFANLTRLRAIAALKRDLDLAAVETVVARMNRIGADIATVSAARMARASDTALDAARLSGADVAWNAWGEGRLRQMQVDMAKLKIEHEAALAAARGSFGRADVLRRLLADEAKSRRPEDGIS